VQCTFSIEETEFKAEMTNKITNLNAGSENFFEGGCVHHGKLIKKVWRKLKGERKSFRKIHLDIWPTSWITFHGVIFFSPVMQKAYNSIHKFNKLNYGALTTPAKCSNISFSSFILTCCELKQLLCDKKYFKLLNMSQISTAKGSLCQSVKGL